MNSKIRHPSKMSYWLFEKLITDLEEFPNPVKTIRLYGLGEPLLNYEFCAMVRCAKASKKVLAVDTTTNASFLNPILTLDLVSSGIDRINISIAAMSTQKYREFTGNCNLTFENIVEQIRILVTNKPHSLRVFIKADADILTADEQQKFYDIFGPLSDGCGLEHTMNCWPDFDAPGVNTAVGIYGQPLSEVQVCPYVFYSFMIHADGYASACFLDWNKKLILGDAKNESLCSLWVDKGFNRLRKMMLSRGRRQHPVCKGCQQLKTGMPFDLDQYAGMLLDRCSYV